MSVRLRLRLLQRVMSEPILLTCGLGAVAEEGVYEGERVQMNARGAVSIATPNGWLGVKPHEFEWLDLASLLEQARRAGCAPLATTSE